jgi:ACS family hexuronate transporter-like MFS transporter
VLQSNGHDYTPIFIVCGLAYVSALLIIQLLVPQVKQVNLDAAHGA